MRTKVFFLLALVVVFLGSRFWQESSVSASGAGGAQLEDLLCYDANDDGALDLSDPVFLLNFLFVGGPVPVACADVNPVDEEARRMAGTFLNLQGAMIQRHADGTFTGYLADVSGVALAGLGTVDLGRLLGSWQDQGARQFRFSGLQFARDVASDELVGFVRWEGTGQYAPDYDSYSVTSTLRVFGPEVDPLNPGDAVPFDTIETGGEAFRLSVSAGD